MIVPCTYFVDPAQREAQILTGLRSKINTARSKVSCAKNGIQNVWCSGHYGMDGMPIMQEGALEEVYRHLKDADEDIRLASRALHKIIEEVNKEVMK